jgi:hypothetical protein
MDLSSEARRMLLAELDERRRRYGAAIEQRSAAHAQR